ncbi:MAG: hypothetical protein M1838_001161 [Thelocarpon superellum]|nr:MAG: hypothetical protein M1838_001161 [Thelocarpon superellum]
MDMPVNVPIDDPNANTEWNDILRKHGIIPDKPPSPTPVIEEAIFEARRLATENRLEGKDLEELDELEDDEDEEFLAKYRYVTRMIYPAGPAHPTCPFTSNQRLAELSTLAKTSVYGQVYPLQKPDYAREVTEASHGAFVIVHLASSLASTIESRLLTERFRELAPRYGDTKFCEIRADMCIEGYPERNCPTILIYHDGDIVKQLITLKELHGERTTLEGTYHAVPAGRLSS